MGNLAIGTAPGSGRGSAAGARLARRYTGLAAGALQDTPLLRIVGLPRLSLLVNEFAGTNTGSVELWVLHQVQTPAPGFGTGPTLVKTVLIGAIGTPELFDVPVFGRAAFVRINCPAVGLSSWDIRLFGAGTS